MTIRDKIRAAEESRKTPEQLEAEAQAREQAAEKVKADAIAAEIALEKQEAIERERMEAKVDAATFAREKVAQIAEAKVKKLALAKENAAAKVAAKEAQRQQKEQEKEAKAKAKAEAEAEAETAAQARAIALAEEKAEEQVRAIAEAEEKARIQAEVQAKTKAEAQEKARIQAEVQAKAKVEAEEKSRLKAAAQARAIALAKEKAEEQVRAIAEAEEKARLKAEAQAKAKAEAKERAKAEALAKARERAEAKAQYQLLAQERVEREAKAREKAQAEALEKVKAEAIAREEAIERAKLEKAAKKKAAVEAKAQEKAEKEALAKAKKIAATEEKARAITKLEADLEAKAIAKANAEAQAEAQAYAIAKAAAKAEAEAYAKIKNKPKNKKLNKAELSADIVSDVRRSRQPEAQSLQASVALIYSKMRAAISALYKQKVKVTSRKVALFAYSAIVILIVVLMSRVIVDRYFLDTSSPLLYEDTLPPELMVIEAEEFPEIIAEEMPPLPENETLVAEASSSIVVTEPTRPPPVLANWQKNAVDSDIPAGYPRLVIVIDDLGMSMAASRKLAKLQSPLTLAFLPYANRLPYQSSLVRKQGHELLVHMPMAPKSKTVNPGNNALLGQLGEDEFHKRLDWNLSRFSGFIGINNHMGSQLTEQTQEMQWVMAELKERGLIFLDSVTTNKSVASDEAQKAGVPHLSRNVFIDNVRKKEAILVQLNLARDMSKRRGLSIAIGHPYRETLDVLKDWLPTLQAEGVILTPLSAAISEKYFAKNGNVIDVVAVSAR